MEINWLNSNENTTLYFQDVAVNQGFRNVSDLSKGAVYLKVEDYNAFEKDYECYAMLEIATGVMFRPTTSPVELVDIKLNIGVEKPDLYK